MPARGTKDNFFTKSFFPFPQRYAIIKDKTDPAPADAGLIPPPAPLCAPWLHRKEAL